MGSVAVLHPRDVLKDSLFYSPNPPNPLISSRSSSSKPSMKSRGRSPNLIPKSNTVIINPNPNPSFSKSFNRRHKQTPQKKKNGGSGSDLSKSPPNSNNAHLVMGQVKILKRGESLTGLKDSCKNLVKEDDSKKACTHIVEKTKDKNEKFDKGSRKSVIENLVSSTQISMDDLYAGSGFISSPSPRSLPMPGFFKRKSGDVLSGSNNNDDATRDLLRILKFDL